MADEGRPLLKLRGPRPSVQAAGENTPRPHHRKRLKQLPMKENDILERILHLIADERLYFGIIVSFVLAAEDQHGGSGHAFESIPGGVDVGGKD